MGYSNQKLIEIAEYYFRSDQYELAKEILAKLISAKEANSKCFELMAYIFGNEGNHQKSKQYLSEACSYADASAEANYYFGKILSEQGQFNEAIKHLKKAMVIAGEFFDALFDLGLVYAQLKNHLNAKKYFQKALFFKPNHVETLFNLAKLHHESTNNIQASKRLYSRVLQVQKNHIPSLIGLGELNEELGELEKAINSYKKVIKVSPFNKAAWLCLGRVLSKTNQINEGIIYLDESLGNQKNVDLFYVKGIFLLYKKHFACALKNFDAAIKIHSENPEVWEGKAIAQFSLGLYDSALLSIEKSISQNAKSASAWKNRGDFYLEVGKYELAIKSYETAIELDPSIPLLISNYLNVKLKCMSWDGVDNLYQKVRADQNLFLDPITLLYLCDEPIFINENNKKYSRSILKNISKPFTFKISEAKKIKIAYLSPDFRKHPVSYLMKDIIKFHDRDQFEIYGFYINNKGFDDLTEEIKKLFDHFIDLTKFSDAVAIELIRNFDIDIAFDLAGHTRNSRTNIFLNRIAKTQINFIGYPNTMGNEIYDYIIADNYLISQSEACFFSEKIIYFPNCFQPNSRRDLDKSNSDGFILDESSAAFVYCCFNFNPKITRGMLELWIDILNATHDSVLWLYVEPHAADNLMKEIMLINPAIINRIKLLERADYGTYLSRFKLANLFLDTYPFGGGTTSSDALLSELPVLTLAGNSYQNRMSKSLLLNLELDELVTHSPSSYKEKAIRLCNDRSYYQSIKHKLQISLSKSQIFDPVVYTKNLESILLSIVKNN